MKPKVEWKKPPVRIKRPQFEFIENEAVELCLLKTVRIPGYDDFEIMKFHNLQDDIVYTAPLHGQLKYFPWVADQLYRVTYRGLEKRKNGHTMHRYDIEFSEGSEAEAAVLAAQEAE